MSAEANGQSNGYARTLMSKVRRIQFCVLPSPETNDFEARLLVDGEHLIKAYWPDMMGMDPDEILSLDFLAPRHPPHTATVVRCGCGVVGCGSVTVRNSCEDGQPAL